MKKHGFIHLRRGVLFAGAMAGFVAVLLGVATETPALAQNDARYGNGPPESTPAEMQQTDQLNQQSGNAAAADLATQAQANAQYQDQQQQYQQQLQYYQAQQQSYDAQRERYYYDRARYYATWPVYVPYGWGYPYGPPYAWGYYP